MEGKVEKREKKLNITSNKNEEVGYNIKFL